MMEVISEFIKTVHLITALQREMAPVFMSENHHSGILCGRNVANYSLVLGSWKYRQCSHLSRYNFIWLTVILALAGMVLVVFLLLVKMIVSSGTINGFSCTTIMD